MCASLRTYHGFRLTPPTLYIQTNTDVLVLPSVHVKTLGSRNKLISKLCQHLREHGLPYGLYDSLCTLRLTVTSFDATLDTDGWLILSRQGLSPCKMHQASLGALTIEHQWIWHPAASNLNLTNSFFSSKNFPATRRVANSTECFC